MCGAVGYILDRIHANKDSIRKLEKAMKKTTKTKY